MPRPESLSDFLRDTQTRKLLELTVPWIWLERALLLVHLTTLPCLWGSMPRFIRNLVHRGFQCFKTLEIVTIIHILLTSQLQDPHCYASRDKGKITTTFIRNLQSLLIMECSGMVSPYHTQKDGRVILKCKSGLVGKGPSVTMGGGRGPTVTGWGWG